MPSGFYNGEVMFADNVSFDGTQTPGKVTTNGQLLIGSSVAPNIRVGTLASADGSVTITTGNGTIDLSAGGGSAIETINGDTGSITGSTVTIYANNATRNAGSTVRFVNSGTVSTLQMSDVRNNVHIGLLAGNLTSSGSGNVSVGYTSLFNVTTGGSNVAIGFSTLFNLTSGEANIGIGGAITNLGSGSRNIVIGASGGFYFSSESDNIIIGNQINGDNGESFVTRIGNDQAEKTFITGIYNKSVGATNLPLIIDSFGKIGTGSTTGSAVISIRSPNINLLSTGTTNVFTATAGNFVVTGITAVGVNLSGAIGFPGANIGTNAFLYDNIANGFSNFANATNNVNLTVDNLLTQYPVITVGQTLVVDVTTADGSATTNTQRIDVQGYYV